jgi:hypothetical protein
LKLNKVRRGLMIDQEERDKNLLVVVAVEE